MLLICAKTVLYLEYFYISYIDDVECIIEAEEEEERE